MANVGSELESSDGIMMNSKLKSPNHSGPAPGEVGGSNTMEEYGNQDGSAQAVNNMENRRGDFLPPSAIQQPNHINSEVNNFAPTSGEQSLGTDNYGKMSEVLSRGGGGGPGFNSAYGRPPFPNAEQHGGGQQGGETAPDFPQQNNQFSHFGQQNMRPSFPGGNPRGTGSPGVRGGMGGGPGGGGMGMMGPYQPSGRSAPGLMSGPNIQQQGGPTPTLNQLLQNASNSNQRPYPGNQGGYGEYAKSGDMGNQNPGYNNQGAWGGQPQGPGGQSQRPPNPMNPYQHPHMSGNQPFRTQGGMYDPSQRRPGMPSGYPQQGPGPGPGHPGFGPGQQFPHNSMGPRGYQPLPGQQGRPGMPGMGPYGQQMPGQYNQHDGVMGYGQPSSYGNPQMQHQQQGQSNQQGSSPGPPRPGAPGSGGPNSTPGQTPSSQAVTSQQQQQPQQSSPQQVSLPQSSPQQNNASQQQQQQQQQQHSNMNNASNNSQDSNSNVSSGEREENNGDNNVSGGQGASSTQQQQQQPQQQQQQSQQASSQPQQQQPPPSGGVGQQQQSGSTPGGGGQQGLASSSTAVPRPAPSPGGSQGSRSNTPASITGNQQASSPMPPLPPSGTQGDNQGQQNRIQSPMATQSYGQPMMPPSMGGPGPMGFGPKNMHGNMMGGPGPIGGQFSQQNSQYPNQPQGQYGRPTGMAGYSGGVQNSYNQMYPGGQGGPMGGMNRGPGSNTNYPGYQGPPPGPPNSMMGQQYGQYNNTNTPPGMPPNQSVPNAGMQQPPMNHMPGSHMNNMGGAAVPPTSTPTSSAATTDIHSPGPKGAQVAAQQAMLAAANSARSRQLAASTTPPAQPPQSSPVPQLSPSQPGSQHATNPPASSPAPGLQQNTPNMPPNVPNMPPNVPPNMPPNVPPNMPPNVPPNMPPNVPNMPPNVPNMPPNVPNMPPNVPPNRGMYPGFMGGGQHGSMGGQYPMNQMPGAGHMDSGMGPQIQGNGPVPHSYNMPNTSMPNQMMGHGGGSGGPNHMGSMGPGQNLPHGMPQMGGHPLHGPPVSMQGSMPPNMGVGPHQPPQQQQQSLQPGLQGMPPTSGSDSRSNTPLLGPMANSNNSSNESNDVPKMPTSEVMVTSAGNSGTTVTQSISTPMTNATETSTTAQSLPPTSTSSGGPGGKEAPVMPPPPPKRESSSGIDSQGENSYDEPPEKRVKTDNSSHPPTPVAPSPSASMSSAPDPDFDNMSSPSLPGTPVSVGPNTSTTSSGTTPAFTQALSEATTERQYQKPGNDGVSKLYDMGEEPERKPFLDKLFAYMDDKGSPITAMPTISKQPIDLYRLYVLVKDKGGILEVTKQKKWRDICSAINIGSSGSAGFTLRKNYVKYLLSFECKYEHGGIDPAPIVQQLDSMSDKKSKNRGNQNPAGGQVPMDYRGQQGYEGFPPQGPPHGMGPHGMMNQGMMNSGYNEGMINNTGMPPNTSVLPNNNMMNSGGTQMMMPNRPMMPNNSDTVSVTDPFADNSNMASSQFPRPTMNYSSGGSMQQNTNSGFPGGGGYNRPPGMAANFPPQGMPPAGAGGGGGGTGGGGAGAGQFGDAMSRGPPQTEHYPNDPRRRGSAPGPDGFQSRGMTQGQEGYPSQYSGPNRGPQAPNMPSSQGSTGTTPPQYNQYPGDNRLEGNPGQSGNLMGPSPGRGPTSQQSNMGPNTQSPDPMFSGRFNNQQRPHTPQEQYGPQGMRTPPPPPQGGASPAPPSQAPTYTQQGPVPQRLAYGSTPGQEQFQGYPGQQMYPGQKQTNMAPGNFPPHTQKRFPEDFQRRDGYNMPPGYGSGNQLAYSEAPVPPYQDSGYRGYNGGGTPPPVTAPGRRQEVTPGGRDQWSRYPPQPGSPYHHPGGSPSQRPGYSLYNQPNNNRLSPQRPDTKAPYASPSKLQKSGSGHGSTFPQKKEIVFPSDSVEAILPVLIKRHRLTQKDIGPTDMWRLVLALKSGLLAESTWALDTLSVLLFDDNTISYFQLHHLPSLVDVLLDQFRRCLIEIFGEKFKDLEESLGSEEEPEKDGEEEEQESRKSIKDVDISPPDREKLEEPENYTLKTRHGLVVKIEKDSPGGDVLFDDKEWDLYSKCSRKALIKSDGRAVRTDHVFTHFEDMDKLEFYRKQFFGRNSKYIPVRKLRREKAHEEMVVEKSEECTDDTELDCKLEVDNPSCQLGCDAAGESPSHNSDSKPDIGSMDSSSSPHMNSCPHTNSPHTAPGLRPASESNKECIDSISNVQIKTEPPDPADTTQQAEPTTNCNTNSEFHNSISSPKSPSVDSSAPIPSTTTNNSSSSHTTPTTTNTSSITTTDGSQAAQTELVSKLEPNSPTIKDEIMASPPCSEGHKTPQADVTANEPAVGTDGTTAEAAREAAYRHHLDERALNDAGMKLVEKLRRQWENVDKDKEAYHHDEPPLCRRSEAQEELARRCVCISNIFRGLSCVPGNERKLSENCGLMRILGRLLLLHHWHPKRRREQPKTAAASEDIESAPVVEAETEDEPKEDEWWWECLEELRENSLVVCANIAGKLSLSIYPESVCLPILDGLLHWAVCASAYAQDPLPTMPSSSVLSAQRLVLETLCKLCIQEQNVDLLLTTPPFSRIAQLFYVLTQLLANRKEQVMREFAIVLLSSLVGGDQVAARLAALTHPAIPLLVDFLETSEHQALQVANSHGVEMLRESPEMMGTSLGMLRRAATTLLHLAKVAENRSLFLHQQQRLLQLVMSQILDQNVASILADVLYQCSQVS